MCDAGLRVWFAPEDVRGGLKLHEQIDEAIYGLDKMLIVLSEYSIQSEWVIREIRRAVKREKMERRRILYPIGLASYPDLAQQLDRMEDPALAENLRGYWIPDFSEWEQEPKFSALFADLLRDLNLWRPSN